MNGREEAVVPHATSEVILSLSEMTKEGHLFPQEYQEPTKVNSPVIILYLGWYLVRSLAIVIVTAGECCAAE